MKVLSALSALLLIILVAAIIPLAYALNSVSDKNPGLEHTEILLNISSGLIVIPESSDFKLESINVNLTFFPISEGAQEISNTSISDNGSMEYKGNKGKSGSVIFNFINPGNISFYASSVVSIYPDDRRVYHKVSFPLKNISRDIERYVRPGGLIDSDNKNLNLLASTIVEGSDDLFTSAVKLARWTHDNVEYNLSTLGQSSTTKASDILSYRRGVCSDLTTLFVALARSVGIPARFTAGIAYTDSKLFKDNWGGHAWAEVYIPNAGWVPFDPTYGQYGFVDDTHIITGHPADASKITTSYSWLGRDVDIKLLPLKIKASIISTPPKNKGYTLIPFKMEDTVKFGQNMLVGVTVLNDENYYQYVDIRLSPIENVSINSPSEQYVILEPNAKKTIFWDVSVNNLDNKYEYTFPLIYNVADGTKAVDQFKASVEGFDVSDDDIMRLKKQFSEKQISQTDYDVGCVSKEQFFYDDEKQEIICRIANTGNKILKQIRLCIEGICKDSDVGLFEEKALIFDIHNDVGTSKIYGTVSYNNESQKITTDVEVRTLPKFRILSLDFPDKISEGEKYNLSYALDIPPRISDVTLHIENKNFTVKDEGSIRLMTRLEKGIHNITVNFTYSDAKNRTFWNDAQFSTTVEKRGLWLRIKSILVKLFKNFKK